jgi:MOSC domain-containing protein YiiM
MRTNCAELENAVLGNDSVLKNTGALWGVVAALMIGPERKESMISVPEVRAIAGAGLEGDRYCRERGTFSKKAPSNQITLLEAEALEAAERDYGLEMAAEESRRNVLTCGVALNHLIGREFQIGEVRLRGLRLCEPCTHLQNLTGKQVLKALRHRGGLRAEILSSGMIKVGERIMELS